MAYYIVNHALSAAINFKAPKKIWSDTLAGYSDFKIFECPVYMHGINEKLDSRVKKCVFLGYISGVRGYRLWYPDSKFLKFIIKSDVNIDEFSILSFKESSSSCQADNNMQK